MSLSNMSCCALMSSSCKCDVTQQYVLLRSYVVVLWMWHHSAICPAALLCRRPVNVTSLSNMSCCALMLSSYECDVTQQYVLLRSYVVVLWMWHHSAICPVALLCRRLMNVTSLSNMSCCALMSSSGPWRLQRWPAEKQSEFDLFVHYKTLP